MIVLVHVGDRTKCDQESSQGTQGTILEDVLVKAGINAGRTYIEQSFLPSA